MRFTRILARSIAKMEAKHARRYQENAIVQQAFNVGKHVGRKEYKDELANITANLTYEGVRP